MDQSIPPVSPIIPPSKPKNHAVMWIVTGAVILTIGIGIGLMLGKYLPKPKQITSYEECVKANGNQITLMFPGTCTTRDGRQFTQPLTDEEKKNLQPPADPQAKPDLAPPDTANWKTYVDSKYGFSFNLPGYYQTENKFWTTDESVNYLSISPQPGNYEGCCFKKSDPVSIRSKAILMESYQNIGTNDWKSKSRFATSHKFIKENVFNENGLSFTKFTALGLGQTGFADDDRLTGFFIQKGTTLIVISVNHFSENQNEAESFIDKILSTFKFVDQSGSVDMSNWKTYTNNKYQFSFRYPNSLVLLDPVGYERTGYKNSTDYQNSLGKTAAITDRLFEFNIDSFPKDTYPDKAKLTFDELIEDAVRGHCGGDGVESSFRCDKLLTSESFVTNNGAQGKKFAYTIITTNSMKKSITQQQTGSLYAFNLSDATTSRIILFHTPSFFTSNPEDQKVFDQILSTFKFTK